MLKIICSYCQTILDYKEGDDGVSHGVCPSCKKKQLRLLEEMIREQQKGKDHGK